MAPAQTTSDELLTIDAGAVHIWWCGVHALERPGVRDACHGLMNEEEKARHDRFLVERVRDEFLLTRGLCRSVLSRYANIAPKDWTFSHNAFGRPEVAISGLRAPLYFNLSNTEGLVAIAVTERVYEVGIDVENLRRRVDIMPLAQRNFSSSEAASLAAMDEGPTRTHAFFAHWTVKEAYIKARGMGMSIPLEQFSIDFALSTPRVSFASDIKDDGAAWQLALFTPTSDHLMALALRRGEGADAAIEIREGLPL